jgi:hypothetical protein
MDRSAWQRLALAAASHRIIYATPTQESSLARAWRWSSPSASRRLAQGLEGRAA